MKEELYRKVYVKSEADLPKEDGNYICLHKGATKLDIFPFKVNESHWFVEIDWYLQPVEQSESKTAEEILDTVYDRDYRSNYKTEYSKQCILKAMEEYRQQQPQKEIKSEIPRAYEWHNYETGHCYVDYVPHVDGKSNILDEKNGYTKIPLYSQQHQKVEQSESKTAITVLRDKYIEKHIINEYTDDSWMHYDDIQAALEAMEEYRQQPQKEQEDTYANGYVFCGKCGYKLGKDNPDEEDVEQDNGWQKDELGWHIPTARELNKIESGLGQHEIIKALSGEEIEDVKTITSTEYVKESYIINDDGSLTPEQEEEKPTDEDVMIYFAKHCKNTKDMKANYQVFTRGMVLELVKWLRDNPQQFKGK
jgi:hypothetical protein